MLNFIKESHLTIIQNWYQYQQINGCKLDHFDGWDPLYGSYSDWLQLWIMFICREHCSNSLLSKDTYSFSNTNNELTRQFIKAIKVLMNISVKYGTKPESTPTATKQIHHYLFSDKRSSSQSEQSPSAIVTFKRIIKL